MIDGDMVNMFGSGVVVDGVNCGERRGGGRGEWHDELVIVCAWSCKVVPRGKYSVRCGR